ncbi:MAG: c-type cytochrome [Motiliproteus sp.]
MNKQKKHKSTLTCMFAMSLLIGTHTAIAEEVSSIARGGQLYDKWFKVIDAKAPKGPHSSYPVEGKYRGKKGADWRCKECHGWDYMGKDGAYSKGKHNTGIGGIRATAGKPPQQISNILKDSTHGYQGLMDDKDIQDLALFVSKGQLDMDRYIDRASKKAKGNIAQGEIYYNTLCAQCHGIEGTKVKDMPAMGKVVSGNPWEGLHKIINGQPGEGMPAFIALDHQVSVDTLAYAQTLPQKK